LRLLAPELELELAPHPQREPLLSPRRNPPVRDTLDMNERLSLPTPPAAPTATLALAVTLTFTPAFTFALQSVLSPSRTSMTPALAPTPAASL
jgi:hypothetical protein